MPYIRNKKVLAVCRSKVRYPNAGAAWRAARKLRRDKGVNARAYPCRGARGEQRHWHVTSGKW